MGRALRQTTQQKTAISANKSAKKSTQRRVSSKQELLENGGIQQNLSLAAISNAAPGTLAENEPH